MHRSSGPQRINAAPANFRTYVGLPLPLVEIVTLRMAGNSSISRRKYGVLEEKSPFCCAMQHQNDGLRLAGQTSFEKSSDWAREENILLISFSAIRSCSCGNARQYAIGH
jgi:hypothetical protein